MHQVLTCETGWTYTSCPDLATITWKTVERVVRNKQTNKTHYREMILKIVLSTKVSFGSLHDIQPEDLDLQALVQLEQNGTEA